VPFTGSSVAISLYNRIVELPPATGTSAAVVVGPAVPVVAAVVLGDDAVPPSSPQAAATMLKASGRANQRDRRVHLISRPRLMALPH
jgi:hypothetical protein